MSSSVVLGDGERGRLMDIAVTIENGSHYWLYGYDVMNASKPEHGIVGVASG